MVLLTRRWPAAAKALAQRYTLIRNESNLGLSASELAEALTTVADVVCPTVTDALNSEVFAAAAKAGIRAKLLANFGVGFNHIDLAAAAAHGLGGQHSRCVNRRWRKLP